MAHSTRELWLAFIAILIITALYLLVVIQLGSVPAARGFFGHSLGILGFILMLMTETLYSRRKRSRSARWGRMASWLQFHIFTGLVGPYLVLLHSSWKLNGLAGVVMLLSIIIVLSGFVGRYIYTSIPRTVDGGEVESRELERAIEQTEAYLNQWLVSNPGFEGTVMSLTSSWAGSSPGTFALIFGRGWHEWRMRMQWRGLKRHLRTAPKNQILQIESLLQRRRALKRQIASLAVARRLLALWHTIHVPIGMVLFFAAFVHILGAIYYATLLR